MFENTYCRETPVSDVHSSTLTKLQIFVKGNERPRRTKRQFCSPFVSWMPPYLLALLLFNITKATHMTLCVITFHLNDMMMTFSLRKGGAEANVCTFTIPQRHFFFFFQCCVSFALSCISGCKQWNRSPLSQSLIRRRIWGERELTCEQRSADCDYSAAGALNRCRLCLLWQNGGVAQLLGHSGAEEPAAATDNISLGFSADLGLLFIGLLWTKLRALRTFSQYYMLGI